MITRGFKFEFHDVLNINIFSYLPHGNFSQLLNDIVVVI